jgi:hypothetical protein
MRILATVLLIGLAGSLARAADKDEDKAKEAAVAFMKAVKAKDLDAVMKAVDVPFLTTDKGVVKVIDKTDDLKADLKAKLEKLKDAEKTPTEVSEVMDLPTLRKKIEGKKDDTVIKAVEKVLGDKGYVIIVGKAGQRSGGVLVRLKDGKAVVVGIPD